MSEFSLEDLLACAKRELALRKNVYPKWVKAGRYTADQARREVAMMEAIVEMLNGQIFWRDR